MATTITMPQLGETVTEGTILSWAKQPGDTIAADEVLLEISTDKVDTEIPSPAAGVVLEILVPAGETVSVGTPLVVIGEMSESAVPAPAPATAPAPAPEQPQPAPAEAAASSVVAAVGSAAAAAAAAAATASTAAPGAGNLSPVVRKLVAEHGVDLTRVTGTGRGGRITRKDVMAAIDAGAAPTPTPDATPAPPTLTPVVEVAPSEPIPPAEPAAAAPVPPTSPTSTPVPPPVPDVAPPPAPAAPPAPSPALTPAPEPTAAPEPTPAPAAAPTAGPGVVGAGDEVVPVDRLRTRIAQNMIKAKQTAAHVWTSVEVDFEALERVRQAHKAAWKAQEGFSLTYLPFIARATIDALAAFPKVNSSFFLDEGLQVFHRSVNLGIAIDLDQGGLVVAPVKGADGLRLRGIAREVHRLAVKARSGNLEPDDVTGGTFAITNPGPFGSFMSAPIINVPNVAILSTDTVVKRPTVISNIDGSDAIGIHHIGYLGLTWDHRAFDGSTAVLFLARIKENIQTWDWERELK